MNYLSLFFVLLLLISCNKKTHEFEAQVLAGKVNNEEWILEMGTATLLTKDSFPDSLSLRLYAESFSNPCDSNLSYTRDYVYTTLPADTGLYTYSFDFISHRGSYAIFEHQATGIRHTAIKGAIEIQEIDTINQFIRGRLDIRYDAKNCINGNFQVEYCR
ncbi:MAG: hypothetical protein MK212_13130 [Saprospiraceae bacterium]|nr:hypothetical protein [Saprospiraceae bacterium]